MLKAYVTGGILIVYAVVLLLVGQPMVALLAAAFAVIILGSTLRRML